ncbi:chordopoxvirus fusion protein [Sulfurihydrogenibium sp.]|jgi:chromosome segregation ATPase|uniref:chordopoxvirus fusion protein n=1 Tax=Sulfurihydrogenibium sp. TaxID=2053621 RepID=UPI00261F69DA|nr:chordopoxvirus fusion protein [Sulfurihydrogenibium sp.]
MQVIPIDFLEVLEELDPKTKNAIIKLVKFLGETVNREDFVELKTEVEKLTISVKDLTTSVKELTENQKKLEEKFQQLVDTQRQTEERLNKLTERVDKLTERLDQLTERVEQLTISVKELTENQKKLEERLIKVEEGLKLTRKEVGGLAHTVGYTLEDRAYKSLPKLLKKDFDIDIEGKLIRTYLELGKEKFIEINIFGKGKQKDKQVVIIGEGKSQLKKTDVDKFLKTIEMIKSFFAEKIIPIMITYQTLPQVDRYAEEKGVKIYYSYDFD